jgi:hypothetical protein
MQDSLAVVEPKGSTTVHDFRIKVPVFGTGTPGFVWCIATEFGSDSDACIPLLMDRFPEAVQILPRTWRGEELVLAKLSVPEALTAGKVLCTICRVLEHPNVERGAAFGWCMTCGQKAEDHPVRAGTPEGVRAEAWFKQAEEDAMNGWD